MNFKAIILKNTCGILCFQKKAVNLTWIA